MATGNDELVLLERVFLRIGSADTDEELEKVLSKFLPPVLLKLSSQGDGVRKKVMELLVHVNKRVKSLSRVKLPLPDLLQQYMDPNVSPFVTNFTILYIKMGYPRMDMESQKSMLPQLIQCIPGKPEPQQYTLLQLTLPVLAHIELPKDRAGKRALFGLQENTAMETIFLRFLKDVLLFPYSFANYQSKPAGGADADSGAPPQPTAPPGLSETAFKQVIGDNPPTPDQLEKYKLGVLRLLGADIFEESAIVVPLAVASADTRHGVANVADRELRRIVSGQDWNDPGILGQLFSTILGTVQLKGQAPVPMQQRRAPASIHMRLKLFPLLLKSRQAAGQFPSCIQVVFACLYAEPTNARLKNLAVQFVHHICLHAPDSSFPTLGAVLHSGMIRLLGESGEDARLRSLAYVAIGKIGRRAPKLVTKDVALLQSFFDAFSKEDEETKLAVQEALSLMAEAFRSIDSSKLDLVEAVITQNIEKTESQARMMAVQYAKSVFPRDHIPSRYVLLLATGDSKEDIFTEASGCLRSACVVSPTDAKRQRMDDNEKSFPDFPAMMEYIQTKSQTRLKSNQKFVMGNTQLAFNPAACIEVLIYLRMCMAYSAGVEVPALQSTDSMQLQAPNLAPYVRKLLASNTKAINSYIDFTKKLMQALGGSPAMYCLLELVAVAPDTLAPQFVKQIDWIQNFAFSSKEDMRELAAQLYAFIVVYGDRAKLTDNINKLASNLKSQVLENQHGSMLVLGHLVGLVLRRKQQGENINTQLHKAMEEAVLSIVAVLESTVSSPAGPGVLSTGACVALGEMGRSGRLPVEDEKKLALVNSLIKAVQTTKYPIKFRERASLCLGELCVGEASFAHRQLIMKGLQDSAGAQQLELHFTAGEALVMAALGTHSSAARDKWTTTPDEHKSLHVASNEDLEVESLLTSLLEKASKSPNPHIKQASCVWLLAVVKECGEVAGVQDKLKDIQLTFMRLLSEPDELTQDISSKGLGLVYEKCGEEQKKELVAILVDTLTTGKRPVNKVTEDTKVFEEGSLGKAPDGQNLSTYKELCSIANDLNQPDLIYKFMHLANHNAMWNSKKGAAFGFSSIAAQAGEQLAPYLSKIVPKMYRYQFDPNPKIQQAMSHIWNALVTNTKETVDKYMLEILDDLLINLTSNQWRVRESSCLAVAEVVRGRPLNDAVDRLPELWQSAFRVRDDIKESVRQAADIACRSLMKASIKICDIGQGKVGEAAISALLPCLLKDGLGSQVKEVRAFSLTTIVKMSQNAGALLKPHIPVLVVALLESLSELEPQYLNYVSLHVAGSQVSQNKLDSARIAASKSSPMMEVINKCVQYVDKDVLDELVPRIRDTLKLAVGLGTKVGCAHLIISLSTHCPHDLSPHAGKILGVLLSCMSDRNKMVRKSYASAIGHVVKIAKDSSVEKLILKLKESYFEKEDGSNDGCALAIHAMAQRAPDVLKRHGALALPLAFLAMHTDNTQKQNSEDEDKTNLWEEVWLETTPGTEAGLRMYVMEVVNLTQAALSSQSWARKAQGARAMKTVATKLGGAGNLSAPHLGLLLSALLSALPGRTWAGKESLLEAISSVCVSCKSALNEEVEGQPSMSAVMEAVLPETQRDNLLYKMAALKCVADIIEKHELDYYDQLADKLVPMLETNKFKEESDASKDTLLELEECLYLTLGRTWPSNLSTQDRYGERLFNVLTANVGQSVWRVELAKLNALTHYFERLQALQKKEVWQKNPSQYKSQVINVVPVICQALDSVKYASIRRKAVSIVDLLVKRLNDLGESCSLCSEERLTTRLEKMSNSDSELREEAKTLNKLLIASDDTAMDQQ